MEKATLGFHIYKIWQILKRFDGTFRRAQILKLGGVLVYIPQQEVLVPYLQASVDDKLRVETLGAS